MAVVGSVVKTGHSTKDYFPPRQGVVTYFRDCLHNMNSNTVIQMFVIESTFSSTL
jgi:hypothetical protein